MMLAVTGHRPDKIVKVGENGYSDEVFDDLSRFLVDKLLELVGDAKDATVITGMALGLDQAVASACIMTGIPLIAAVPFKGQESVWPPKAKERYANLLAHAKEVRVVSEGGYAAWKMQTRNIWMIDRCDRLLALWNGSPGGTGNCIAYAKSKGIEPINCWDDWQKRHERGKEVDGLWK